MTPQVCGLLVAQGHEVYVQSGAGAGSHYPDDAFAAQGATLVATATELWNAAEVVVKVKQPLPPEYPHLRPGLLLYCFLHLAAEPGLTETLLRANVTGIAAETIETVDGALPVLAPMSEIAGKMTLQVAAHLLSKPAGGIGRLLSGVVGVPPAKVLVLGGGTVGTAAARMALGVGAEVTVLDRSHRRLVYLQEALHGNLVTMLANEVALASLVPDTDVMVGAILVPGARTPALVPCSLISTMREGSVAIDVSIDQGGCFETSRPTHHSAPTYVVDGVIHYCVVNMPGAVPRTSSQAFAASSYPYIAQVAAQGLEGSLTDPAIAKGVNTYRGHVAYRAVAESLGLEYVPLNSLVSGAAA